MYGDSTWWRTREEELYYDACETHVAETPSKDRQGTRRGKEEEDETASDGRSEVDDTIWQPC
jgi:hypothetical protein